MSQIHNTWFADVDGNAALSYSTGSCQRSADQSDSAETEQGGDTAMRYER